MEIGSVQEAEGSHRLFLFCWAAFLEGFALDRARLRAAGEALLKGGGDVADALVAAAPGLGEVLATRDRLTAEAAAFHNHQRKAAGTELQKALAARDAARKVLRETEVRADEVKRVNQAFALAAACKRSSRAT